MLIDGKRCHDYSSRSIRIFFRIPVAAVLTITDESSCLADIFSSYIYDVIDSKHQAAVCPLIQRVCSKVLDASNGYISSNTALVVADQRGPAYNHLTVTEYADSM